MGQQPNKYHISDEGIIYRVNEDGSFTSVGNVEDIEKKPSSTSENKMPPPIPTPAVKTSGSSEVGWWIRNYNWLWLITLVIFIGWFISCLLSCSCLYYPIYECGFIDYVYNFGEILGGSVVILIFVILSWRFSSKGKLLYKFLQIPLVVCCGWIASVAYWKCEHSFLLLRLAVFPFMLWIITICKSLFGSKRV